jgi:glycine hydroxymethyltransferase
MDNELKITLTTLKKSLELQSQQFKETLILNPVENIPVSNVLKTASGFLHGLYNTDTLRSNKERYNSKLQFSGRNVITQDVSKIYNMWAQLLGAKELSMRLLSGLHSHIIVFMGLCDIGDRVLILPEKAGGHLSGWAILQRLGIELQEIPYNENLQRIDKEKCLEVIDSFSPQVIFVDRSEGLIYEDFSWLGECCSCYKIFDASQYLTNILAKHYKNPFDMGFDLMVSSMHKNLPGPQHAFVCSRESDAKWSKLKKNISTYVSNMHVFSIYSAGLLLEQIDQLVILSQAMLDNAVRLEHALKENNIPVVTRLCSEHEPPTHHCWIRTPTQEKAFSYFLDLERVGLLTNYRLLPYNIGYGLRLGLSGATQSGLNAEHIELFAKLMAKVYHYGYTEQIHKQIKSLIYEIKKSKL